MEPDLVNLLTQNFSRTGLCFPAPRRIEPGQPIEVEVTLKGTGPGGEDIKVSGTGRILRTESGAKPGWYELAAVFDEPGDEDESGWYKLAASFDEPPPSAKNS